MPDTKTVPLIIGSGINNRSREKVATGTWVKRGRGGAGRDSAPAESDGAAYRGPDSPSVVGADGSIADRRVR